MFTVCPKCTLTLVVTTVDLRAGQGYVRCGRCANVFNALIALREGDPSTVTSDSARQRIIQTPPNADVKPAMGAGVAMTEPEPAPAPEPEPGPVPEPEPESALELEPQPEPESLAGLDFPEPEADPASEPESAPEDASDGASIAPEFELSFEEPASPAEENLEFNETATDVSEIFVSPSRAEHDTGSGNYEAVVLAEEPQPEPSPEPEPVFEEPEPPHTDTIVRGDWSLLDDDDVPADAESVIEESPLAQEAGPEPQFEPDREALSESEPAESDPAWVQEMFAEAEVEALRSSTARRPALHPVADEDSEEPAVLRAARDVKGVSAASGDTAIEPLLEAPKATRPPWQYSAGIGLLTLVLLLQIVHHNRQSLVLNNTFGPTISKIYGWFGATPTPRWDLSAYTVKQLGAEAEGSEGTRLRVRLSVQNDSDRVQPLPLLRLTLQDRYGNAVATRDLEPREYLPPRAAGQRLLEPDQRIDAELHVIDPGKAAIGFEIDACLRGARGNIGCAHDARRRSAG
ncbi:MAG TPA: zinc-ribbon and DUF3426 domain-containing protein [Steroidobacteraceae bacterium]|nr:zinc-ribbon and DUF3426 domain-containing protein [Steroidobacteraceae bacterium]